MLVRRRHQHRPTPRSRRKQKVKPADPPNPLEEAPGKQPRSQAQSSLASPQRAAPQQARQVRLPQTRSRRDSLPGAVIPLSGLGQDIVYNDDRPSKDVSPVDSRDCDLLRDLISSKFDQVITSIDGETFTGEEEDLGMFHGSSSSCFLPFHMHAHGITFLLPYLHFPLTDMRTFEQPLD